MITHDTQSIASPIQESTNNAHSTWRLGVLRVLVVFVIATSMQSIGEAGEYEIKAGFERWNTTYVGWVPFWHATIDEIEAIVNEGDWRIVDIEQDGTWDFSSNDPNDYLCAGIMVRNEGIYESDWQLLINEPGDVRNWCKKYNFRPIDIEHLWVEGGIGPAGKVMALVVRNSGNQYTPKWDFGVEYSFNSFSKIAQDMASQRLVDIEIESYGNSPLDCTYTWITVSNSGDQYVPTLPGFWFNYSASDYFTAIENGWQPIDVEIANVNNGSGQKAYIGIFVKTESSSDFIPDLSTSAVTANTQLNRYMRAVDLELQDAWMMTYLQTIE